MTRWILAILSLLTFTACGGHSTPAPTARVTASPGEGVAPLDVRFTDASNGIVTQWRWDFGDGTTSTEQNPSHRFDQPGTYTVTLVVHGPGGQNSATQQVAVQRQAEAFSATPESGVAPVVVRFTATPLGGSSPRWDFGDGQTGEGSTVEHRYELPGVYTAALGVDTPAGPKILIHTITVLAPLAADFAATPMDGSAALTVRFTDQSSGDVVSRSWEFGDGGTDTTAAPTHTYTAAGTFTAKLTVTGPTGTQTTTRTITVRGCDDASAAARVRPSVVRIQSSSGVGTGMVVGASGFILTANHVVATTRVVAVTLATGRVVTGQVTAHRADQDLALVHVDVTGLTSIAWGDDRALQPGQRLLGLGYALDLPGEPTVTGGLFSARRAVDGVVHVQTDTPLNPGNSGGPLFTVCGEVVGVVVFGLRNTQGLNFAVAAVEARPAAEAMMSAPAPSSSVTLSPTETVALFYALIDQRRYDEAYALLSRRYQAQQPFPRWRDGYSTTLGVYIEDVAELSRSPAIVGVSVIATDLLNGRRVVRRFSGTWTLVQEGSGWKMDLGQIREVP